MQWLIVGWFALSLVLPMVATVAGVGRGELEQRRAAEPPAWDGGASLARVGTYEQLGRFVSERFALRSVAVRGAARLDELLWRADTAQVRRGRDGWLFLDASLRRWCDSPVPPGRAIERFEGTVTALQRSGRRTLLAVAPEKSSVYPGQLSERAARDGSCSRALVDGARATLATRPWNLDRYAPLLAAAPAAAKPLYHPRDTHWTPQGAAIYAATLVGALAPGVWSPACVEAGAPRHFVPDLTRLLGLARDEREVPLRAACADVHTERSAVAPTSYRSTAAGGRALVGGHTVVVHDSFTLGAVELLAPWFAEVTFVHWDELERLDVTALLAGADTVVLQVAERTLLERADVELEGLLRPAAEALPVRSAPPPPR